MSDSIKQWKEEVERILIKDKCLIKSPVEGLPDLIWSCACRSISYDTEKMIQWFYSRIPAFDNRVPMDILKEDGEDALFSLVMTIYS